MAKSTTLLKKLTGLQEELKVPKGQTNSFGGYKYRSTEDILEALKPHLSHYDLTLILSDELVNIGDRYYVKASATLSDSSDGFTVHAYAREEESKKGMDGSQITGAASSYARKYALNGLFLIDDTKDPDATNTHDKAPTPAPVVTPITAVLLDKVRRAFKDAGIEGDEVTNYCQMTIGKPKPETNVDGNELLEALRD